MMVEGFWVGVLRKDVGNFILLFNKARMVVAASGGKGW
jgi:hypothetical protein